MNNKHNPPRTIAAIALYLGIAGFQMVPQALQPLFGSRKRLVDFEPRAMQFWLPHFGQCILLMSDNDR
jgi:hypothetical protein